MRPRLRRQAAAGLLPFALSLLASSHHWIHMGILLLFGGSTGLLASMSTVLWIRRVMIAAAVAAALLSIYRLYRQRCRSRGMTAWTILSSLLSLGMVVLTLRQYGW